MTTTTSYTVEYASSSGIPAVLVFRTLAQARGKARLLRRIGRDPVIYRRDANGATLVHVPSPSTQDLENG